jgi:CHAT domain-containing protein
MSHALYTLLIPEAVRAGLTDQDALIIVPTGPLYALPFELLLTQPATTLQEAQYLIEACPISYLSSASLLNTLREAHARRTSTARYPLLAFAHPAYRREAVQESDRVRALRSHSYRTFLGGEFTELPETADEARAIAEVLNAPQESDPLQLRAEASRANVFGFHTQDRLDDYHYLIFAMHGVLPGDVDQVTQSALVLSDDFLTMADVFGLQLNASLVSLSACNTGRGTQVKGEGVMGLTRAFMYAGTPAVAVTLWSVESLSAKDLDIGFFRHLNAGLSPARALQAIKVQMLRGDLGEAYRHPYYWAPFVLFGDGL